MPKLRIVLVVVVVVVLVLVLVLDKSFAQNFCPKVLHLHNSVMIVL